MRILAQDLRLAVLQYAIEGKLSERKATDTSTKTTLVELKAKKESLIKEKKLKHQYKDIVNDDFPFEIPNTWEWVKLNDIGELSRGKSKHRPRNDDILYTNGTVPLIQTGDIASADKYISQYNVCYNNKGVAQSRLWKKGTLS